MTGPGIIRGLEVADAPGTIQTLETVLGTPGASAYSVWLAQGNTGTEAQFLASLKGAPSTVAGPPGQSAYQAWLAAGNTGTQADFLNSLKGPKGDASTVPGPRGTKRHSGAGAPGTIAGAIQGDDYLNTTTGDLYGYNGTSWALQLNLKGPAGTGGNAAPRGTGGTVGRMVTRAAGTATWADLTPGSPAEAFAAGRVALIDADNRVIGRGQTGRVTGLGLTAGRRYYVEFPVSGTAPNLTAVPEPVPAGWPTAGASNVDRRYYLAGETYADGAEVYFLHYADAGVELSDVPAPVVKRLDVAALPYDTDLLASGHFTRLVQGAAQNGAAPRLVAQGDAAHPATWAASSVTKDIAGVIKPVQVRFIPFGESDYIFPTAWDAQLGGDLLLRLQSDSGFDTSRPGVFFCSTGGMTAGTLGTQYRLKMYSGQIVVVKATSDGRTVSADTNLSATVPIAFTSNELWDIRLRVTEADKKVYVRCWKAGTTEPTTWQVDGLAIPELTAGRWGMIFRNGVNGVTRAALAPSGVAASYV